MKRSAVVVTVVLAAFLAALVATSISTAAPVGVTKAADLFAGKTTDVGDVFVWNDATNLFVELDLTGGWCMTESHVAAAATLAGIPQVNGNPPPGQFPYGDTYAPCATTDTFTIPLAGLGANPVIAVHAKVWDPASETTLAVVSDTATTVTAFNGVAQPPAAAVAAYEPVGYPNCDSYVLSPAAGSVWDTQNGGSASNDTGGPFAGATWIWPTSNPAFPDAGEYATFARTFNLPGPPVGPSSILITADNGYRVSLNGGVLGDAQLLAGFPASLKEDGVSTTGWQTPETWGLPVQMGLNTLSVVAANEFAYPGDPPNQQTTGIGGVAGGVCPNPGGLIFKATASYLADSESAWAGTSPGQIQFPGKNWATYFQFAPVDWADTAGDWVLYSAGLDRQAKFSFGVAGGEFSYDDETGGNAYHAALTAGVFDANSAYACGTVDTGPFVGEKLLLKVTDGDGATPATADSVWGSFVGFDPCAGLGTVNPADGPFTVTGGEVNVLNVP